MLSPPFHTGLVETCHSKHQSWKQEYNVISWHYGVDCVYNAVVFSIITILFLVLYIRGG